MTIISMIFDDCFFFSHYPIGVLFSGLDQAVSMVINLIIYTLLYCAQYVQRQNSQSGRRRFLLTTDCGYSMAELENAYAEAARLTRQNPGGPRPKARTPHRRSPTPASRAGPAVIPGRGAAQQVDRSEGKPGEAQPGSYRNPLDETGAGPQLYNHNLSFGCHVTHTHECDICHTLPSHTHIVTARSGYDSFLTGPSGELCKTCASEYNQERITKSTGVQAVVTMAHELRRAGMLREADREHDELKNVR